MERTTALPPGFIDSRMLRVPDTCMARGKSSTSSIGVEIAWV